LFRAGGYAVSSDGNRRGAPAKRSKRRRAGRLALRPLPGIPFNQIRLTCGY
jgi:hypothetical protein